MLTQTRTTAKLRTGEEYVRSIKADGRQVFVNGELVKDVTTHPAFKVRWSRWPSCSIWRLIRPIASA